MILRSLPLVALGVLLLAFAAVLGTRSELANEVGDSIFGAGGADVAAEALEAIDEDYYREVDREELQQASVRAMIRQLRRQTGDRFSHYFGPDAYAHFRQATEGSFSGVGMSVVGVKRGLRVAMVFEGSPAQRAGIERGDVITGVNGESIAGKPPELATELIKGEPGTEVELTVRSGSRARTLSLERATVELPVVDGRIVSAGGAKAAYVRLLSFTGGAHAKLRMQIDELRERGARGLILDLRGNGGGLLNEAVLTSSVFVEDGKIVSTSGRTQRDRTYPAVGDALPEQPMVVLINRDTASAAEILAAAVSDAGVATLVGRRTFGKGVFQEVIPLQSGGALSLTVGEYLARDGESLAGSGIEPDVRANDDLSTEPDEALRRARSALGNLIEQG